MCKKIVTQKRLKELLHYDPSTGIFVWLISRRGAKAGNEAGSLKSHGYIYIMIENKTYGAHRLAFLYMTGLIPKQVDHDDHDRGNNKWDNLNPATSSINNRNRSLGIRNTSGTVGVCWRKDKKKWWAQIMINNKTIHLGYFNHKTEAVKARKKANIKYDFHKNHGG